jgi:hypothetical protein
MSTRLNPPKEMPESITTSNRKFLRREFRTRLASLPSTSMRPSLTSQMVEPWKSTATRRAYCFALLIAGIEPSSTPTILKLGLVFLEGLRDISEESTCKIVLGVRVCDHSR